MWLEYVEVFVNCSSSADEQSVTNSGRLFHARGPATAKARSSSDERLVAGTARADDDADRRDKSLATVPL